MKKITVLAICTVLVICLFAGCGLEDASVFSSASADYPGSFTEYATEEAVADTAAEAVYEETAEAEESASGSSIADTSGGVDVNSEPKLVYSSNFILRTYNFDEDYDRIKELTEKSGGFIEYEYMYSPQGSDVTGGRSADLTVRIPADNYVSYTDTVDGIAYTESRTSDVSNISDTYYDVDSRIELLEERKERLYGHLEEATKMEDKIAIEDEIAEVIYQLDELKSQKRGMDSDVEYSTVSISLQEITTAAGVDTSNPDLDPGNSFTTAFINFSSFICLQLNDLASSAPVLIIIAAMLIVLWFAVRSVSKKNGLCTQGLSVLIISILGAVFSVVFSLAGLVLGILAVIMSLHSFKESRTAKAAFIIGIAAVCISVFLIIIGTAAGADYQYFW